MTFSTVKYEFLRDNILKLGQEYSSCLARFKITNSNNVSHTKHENNLEVLLSRVNEYVIQCDTERKSQRDVFTKLTGEIRGFINGTPLEIKRATLYLLGGLIHRFLRIETEYAKYNESKYNPYTWFSSSALWDVNHCGLYKAIEKALQLSETNKLDEYTIINALEVFKENMYMEIETEEVINKIRTTVKKERYKTYDHFGKLDPNFKKNLEIMIYSYRKVGAEIIRHFDAIYFLQSLMNALEKENYLIEEEIKKWCEHLSKTYNDFNQLNEELIKLHFADYSQSMSEKKIIKERIDHLLWLGFKAKDFASIKTHKEFLEEMCIFNTDESRSICCGAYVLLLREGQLDERLVMLMTNAFGFNEKLTANDQLACLEMLKTYINYNPKPKLNCSFFKEGWEGMVSQIIQLSVSLGEKDNPLELINHKIS